MPDFRSYLFKRVPIFKHEVACKYIREENVKINSMRVYFTLSTAAENFVLLIELKNFRCGPGVRPSKFNVSYFATR